MCAAISRSTRRRRQRPGMNTLSCCASSTPAPAPASKSVERVPLVQLKNVHYCVPMDYDRVIFKNLNLSIYPGELVLITGLNGSGKSTALKLISGLNHPDSGELYWKNERMKPKDMVKKVGVMMQMPGNYFFMRTILQELVMGRITRTPDDVRKVMAQVGLFDISLSRSPKSLSGGETRRLALASQIMREPTPEVITLDEPLVGVDWDGREDIIKLLGELKRQFALVIVSHEPKELLIHCDRLIQIANGEAHEVERNVIDKALLLLRKRQEEAERGVATPRTIFDN